MEAFASGRLAVLVATTVIEVGVDVPNATLMVVEHADRFGLAQLHQLRGRVGRGDQQSVCLLLRGNILSETGRARLALMRETNDGFRIAEEDLRLRGAAKSSARVSRERRSSASPAPSRSPHSFPQRWTTPAGWSTATAASKARVARRHGPCSTYSNATQPWVC